MKRISYILLLFLTFNAFQAKSQTYYPLVRDSVHWFVAVDNQIFGPGTYGSIFEYYSIGDTTVSSTLYKKVYKRDIESVNSNYLPPYQPMSSYSLFALLREDTANKKVYSITLQNNPFNFNCAINQEELLYDFNLNVGDTVNNCTQLTGHPCPEVNLIFPSTTYFGYNTKLYRVGCLVGATDYYEGIGSWDGLLEDENFVTATVLRGYCRGADIDCGLTTGVSINSFNNSFSVFPNPTKGVVQIHSSGIIENPTQITISDISGKIIKRSFLGKNKLIDLSNLKKGVYFLRIGSKKSILHFSKIIKL